MRQVLFGNYWEDSTNYAYIKGTKKIIEKKPLIDELNELRNNPNLIYISEYLTIIKENKNYYIIDSNTKIFSTKSLDPNDWFEEIPDEDIDQYEYLFFE